MIDPNRYFCVMTSRGRGPGNISGQKRRDVAVVATGDKMAADRKQRRHAAVQDQVSTSSYPDSDILESLATVTPFSLCPPFLLLWSEV